ncbi:transcription initiation protein SPT3 homolog isoform X2 [Gordionus sp. m RMFG-2023]|uniref:transcription initiation protein SPT3 homolog isoform X2 n=1 Tax=Gordionus sp. m RMFG-2023 TaxID=3053472 RepID=UPI0031FCE50E
MQNTQNVVDFYDEIRFILATNGDRLEPFDDTVELVNYLILNELKYILTHIKDINKEREFLNEDIIVEIFLDIIRDNKIQTQRFVQWLATRKLSSLSYDSTNIDMMDNTFSRKGKIRSISVKRAYEYLKINFGTLENEINDSINIMDIERKERLDYISSILSLSQYYQFKEMKNAGFMKSKSKIKKWILSTAIFGHTSEQHDPHTCLRLTDNFLEIVSYFAKEIVLCIIDAVYGLKKHEKKAKLPAMGNSDFMETINSILINTPVKLNDNIPKITKSIPNFYRIGITVHDINNAIGHLYTQTMLNELKTKYSASLNMLYMDGAKVWTSINEI